jgi:hypothetical protein
MSTKNKKKPNFKIALEQTRDLSSLQKTIFEERFLKVLREFEHRCFFFSIVFHILRILVSVGSLIVPALLSIQYSDTSSSNTLQDPESFAYSIYWATWVISLLVTTSNGILTVFKIDKKYYFLHTTMEQLRSEGWQFLQLSGHYTNYKTPEEVATHENQFVYFCHAIEKIKMRQVEEEYFKLVDNSMPEGTKGGTDGKEKKESLHSVSTLPTFRISSFQDLEGAEPTKKSEEFEKTISALKIREVSKDKVEGGTSEP